MFKEKRINLWIQDNLTIEPAYPCGLKAGDLVRFTNKQGIDFDDRMVVGFSLDDSNDGSIRVHLEGDTPYWIPMKLEAVRLMSNLADPIETYEVLQEALESLQKKKTQWVNMLERHQNNENIVITHASGKVCAQQKMDGNHCFIDLDPLSNLDNVRFIDANSSELFEVRMEMNASSRFAALHAVPLNAFIKSKINEINTMESFVQERTEAIANKSVNTFTSGM